MSRPGRCWSSSRPQPADEAERLGCIPRRHHRGHRRRRAGRRAPHLECQYLRQRFGGQGTRFVLTLKGCTLFAFTPYVGAPCANLSDIQQHQPEILYVEQRADLVLLCTTGEITLCYDCAHLALDTGQPVTSDELVQAARSYWQEWDSQRR